MDQSKQRTNPFFIVGAPRSGTTLLQYMMRSHPLISMPTGESHFMIPLNRMADSFGNLCHEKNIRLVLEEMYQRSAEFLDSDLHGMSFNIDSLANELQKEGCNSISTIISGLFNKNAQGEGKQRWGDKTPYYVLHLPTIIKMFPGAQIIHIIRDGRDCALSTLARKYDFNVYNMYQAAKLWEQYVEVGHHAGLSLSSDVYLEIRYEDLLSGQINTMQKICKFLDIPFSNSLIEYRKSGGGKGKTPLLKKPVQKDNSEKWRKQMTHHQIRVFESVAGDTLSNNGYQVVTSTKSLPLALRAAYLAYNRLLAKYNRKFRKRK